MRYPEGGFTTQPRVAAAHPGNQATETVFLPRRGCTTLVLHLIQRFQRSPAVLSPFPGCAAATLGCVVKPLRGTSYPTIPGNGARISICHLIFNSHFPILNSVLNS